MKRTPIALLAALLLTACGEDLVVRIPIADVCRTLASQQVPASPMPGMDVPAMTWEQAETITLGDVLPERRSGNVELHLYVRGAELSATGDAASLGFIQSVGVTLDATADGTRPEVQLASYQKPSDDAAPTTITLSANAVNLMDYVQNDTLSFTETFKGVPPQQQTEVTPKLCVGGEAVYTVDLTPRD